MMKQIRKRYGRWWQLYVFLLIPVIYIVLFKYVPMLGIQMAFRRFTFKGGIWNSPWVGLDHFSRFLNNFQFKRVFSNTLLLSFYNILAGFPIPILFALALNSVLSRSFKKTVQTVSYLPHFISTVVLVGILKQLFHPTIGLYGLVCHLLGQARPTDLFASAPAFPHLYVWSGVWQGFGWGSVIYLANLTAVSPELHEAAEIDGATRFSALCILIFHRCFLPS